MEIVDFEDVKDGDMTELTLTCFNHTYSREQVEEMIKADSRMPDWSGEMYAKKKNKVVGTVGILYPRVRLEKGVEEVGGIRNVCTRPSASDRGVATTLLKEAHSRMREEDVRYSFLMTSASFKAYSLYRKLGYEDVMQYRMAYKKVKDKKENDVQFREETWLDFVRELYTRNTEGLLGLVIREEDFWGMAEARGWPRNDKTSIAYREGEKIGYANFTRTRRHLVCKEIAAKGKRSLRAILERLEEEANECLVLKFVNPKHVSVLREEGFNVYNDTWDRLMVKPLGPNGEEVLDRETKKRFHLGVYEAY